MEVEIISKDYIKPSSPTPPHLKDYKLSFLDLYLPPFYIPIVLYYPSLSSSHDDSTYSKKLQQLKQSLSETLSLFYPLAGKIRDVHSIDCNDDGVYFAEARVVLDNSVSVSLQDFLKNPNLSLIKNFLPDAGFLPDARKWDTETVVGRSVVGVQVTRFPCGGVVIGIFVSHMIADGTGFGTFLKSWVARAQKNDTLPRPEFNATRLFPQNDKYTREVCMAPMYRPSIRPGKCVTKRFVFDEKAIANLKSKVGNLKPTRVEAVTALFCKSIMPILKSASKSDKPFLLNHAVNLRRKATPPLSQYEMGNVAWIAAAALSSDEEAPDLEGIIGKLREAMGKVNGEFVNSFLDEKKGFENFIEAVNREREISDGSTDRISFSSWCNFGFYEFDFGWGKPAWASVVDYSEMDLVSLNLIILMDTKVGNGVEAWVFTHGEDMVKLQADQELLAFATVDQVPITNIHKEKSEWRNKIAPGDSSSLFIV